MNVGSGYRGHTVSLQLFRRYSVRRECRCQGGFRSPHCRVRRRHRQYFCRHDAHRHGLAHAKWIADGKHDLTEPQGVESLILASPALDIPRWLRDTNRLKSQLPEEVQEAIDRHEQAGTTDSEEYQAATMEFYRRHLCRSDPWPVELEEAFA